MLQQKHVRLIAPCFMIVLLFFTLLFSGCTQSNKTQTTGEDFPFTTLTGETTHLHNYYGNVIVLDLMAVNCQPCMMEMLALHQIYQNYTSKNVTVLSIDVWVMSGETSALLQQYLNEFRVQINLSLDWTFGLDDTRGTIEQKYASEGVPTLYVLDTKGNIYYSHVGYEDYATLSSTLDEILGNI